MLAGDLEFGMRVRTQRGSRSGFTLVEALVSIALAAIAGSVLLVGVNSSLNTTRDALRDTVALGIAERLMDEIVSKPRSRTTTSPSQPRVLFDDIMDYTNYAARPPVDPWKIALGRDDGQGGLRHPNFQDPSGLIDNWQEQVIVQPIREDGTDTALAAAELPKYLAVEVRIICTEASGAVRELARLKRVVAYVD